MTPITAIYENGVFRPTGPVNLPEGSTVRIEPVSSVSWSADVATDWTEEKDERRCDLIDREMDGSLTPDEAIELQKLQSEMLKYRRKVAPLPLDDARKLHAELLEKARQAAAGGS